MFFCVALKLEPGPQVRIVAVQMLIYRRSIVAQWPCGAACAAACRQVWGVACCCPRYSRGSGLRPQAGMRWVAQMTLASSLAATDRPFQPPLPTAASASWEQELRMQEDELVGVRWLPLSEYLAIDFHSSRPLLRQIQAACVAWADGKYR